MNFVEFADSLITGEWRLRRAAVREQRAFQEATREKRQMMIANHMARQRLYAGAEPGMNRKMPAILSTPEDYKQAYERYILMRAAREMEEDMPFFDGLLHDFELFVVGEEPVYMPNTGNPDADRAIREFVEWQFDIADYSNRLDFTKIMQLAVRTVKRDGECGFIPVDVGDAIQLHYVSGDCIGNPLVGANIGPNNYNGIIVDEATNAPRIYRLYKRLPKLNAYEPDRDVPAEQFWHYYDPFRMQQFHGVTTFKNMIRHAYDIDEILEFTKVNIKYRASQLPTIHNESGRPRGAGFGYFALPGQNAAPGSPTDAAGIPRPLSVTVDGVQSQYLKLDEQIVEYPHDFPNQQVGIAIDELRREACKGANIPYEFAYRADAGGVVLRFWVDKAMQQFKKDRRWLKRQIANPYKNRVIQKGIETGMLDLRRFGTLANDLARFRGTWQMGGSVSVDYGRETDADIKQLEAGLMSPQSYAAEQNRDLTQIDDELEQRANKVFAAAKRVAQAQGVDLALVLPFIVKKFPNPGAGLAAAGASGGVSANPDDPVK